MGIPFGQAGGRQEARLPKFFIHFCWYSFRYGCDSSLFFVGGFIAWALQYLQSSKEYSRVDRSSSLRYLSQIARSRIILVEFKEHVCLIPRMSCIYRLLCSQSSFFIKKCIFACIYCTYRNIPAPSIVMH
jgi:hypothetical protein